MHRRLSLALAGISIGFLFMSSPLRADSPSPGVARVSLIHGNVATMRGDSGDWVAAVINAPMVTGDALSTGPDSRAEVQLDYANILRLADQTQVRLANLTPFQVQLQVSQGLVDFVTLHHSEAQVEIDTPNVAVRPLADGVYRIQVKSDSEMTLVVRRGEAEVSTPDGSTRVEAGQMITVEGTDHPEYQVTEAPPRDDWDNFNEHRDQQILQAHSWQYTNFYYAGAYELDAYGRWVEVPGYGWCWAPAVAPGWVPYSYGRWVWEPYWGWTWVSYEPWGWAPYHYGRWFIIELGWVWWPGPVAPAYRPLYAPAYVAFFGIGGGGGVSFGFAFGTIGWLPIGPSDAYHPWWGYRNTYNAVNITNITNITNVTNVRNVEVIQPLARPGQPVHSNLQAVITDARVRQAMVTVSARDFVAGRIPARPRPLNLATLRQAHLIQGTLPVVPTRQSLQPANRPVSAAAIPSRPIISQRFYAKTPPPAGPRPFSERVNELQQMVRQTSAGASAAPYSGRSAPASKPVLHAAGPSGRPDWEQPEAKESAGAAKPSPGWHSFGEVQPGSAPRGGNPPSAVKGPFRTGTSQSTTPNTTPPYSRASSSPETSRQTGPTQATSSAPSRPGWHRFGEEKGQSKPATKYELEQKRQGKLDKQI
jgi:hypothetical protein